LRHETSKRNESDRQELVMAKNRLEPLRTPFFETPTRSGFPYRYFLFQLLCYPVKVETEAVVEQLAGRVQELNKGHVATMEASVKSLVQMLH